MMKAQDTGDRYTPVDFSKIKVGAKTLDDAVLNLGQLRKINPSMASKQNVLMAIARGDIDKLRQISNFFYRTSGIYMRLCKYMANLYKYDWFITPYIQGCQGLIKDPDQDIYAPEQIKSRKKSFNSFFKILDYYENIHIKALCNQIALKVLRNGVYYGYLIPQSDTMAIQQLHPRYCRSRMKVNNEPVVEFKMSWFDDMYPDRERRDQVLKLYPKDFKRGYGLYHAGKLPPAFPGDDAGWYMLDPEYSVKFNLNEQDYPVFVSVIPAIIDLDQAQDLDRKKMAQQLIKIIIQRMPLDKNGDLVFDVDEAQELHNNAVQMLKRAIGIDVLTTFADVDVADMADKSTTTSMDELQKVERGVYLQAGTAEALFNSDGNLALTNSILNDESSMYTLVCKFEALLNRIYGLEFKKNKHFYCRVQILPTTIYNYKEVAKLYVDQAKMGYSKMLPAVALGQSQSSILANMFFENDILDLVSSMVPPLTSNTMNSDALVTRKQNQNNQQQSQSQSQPQQQKQSNQGGGKIDKEEKSVGRPQKPDEQKSDKTIANRQAM